MAAMRSIGSADLPRTAAFVCTLRTPQLSSELVKSEGTGATSIVVSGSNPVIARSLRAFATAPLQPTMEAFAKRSIWHTWSAYRLLLASRAKQLFVLMCHEGQIAFPRGRGEPNFTGVLYTQMRYA